MKRLFLSAGHNLNKPGAHKLIDETTETIRLRDSIIMQTCVDSKVGKSQYQTDDDYMSLTATINAVNQFCGKDDLAVELHFNSSTNPTATGVEALISNNAIVSSKAIAKQLTKVVADTLHLRNRGVKPESKGQHKTLGFVSKTHCAAVILEICFISNQSDVDSYLQHNAELVDALAKKFESILL